MDHDPERTAKPVVAFSLSGLGGKTSDGGPSGGNFPQPDILTFVAGAELNGGRAAEHKFLQSEEGAAARERRWRRHLGTGRGEVALCRLYADRAADGPRRSMAQLEPPLPGVVGEARVDGIPSAELGVVVAAGAESGLHTAPKARRLVDLGFQIEPRPSHLDTGGRRFTGWHPVVGLVAAERRSGPSLCPEITAANRAALRVRCAAG